MSNKLLTSRQPKVLSNKACDAFQIGYAVQVFHGVTGWHCENRACGKIESFHPTRQAAITAYWQKYHKDWTPPVEDTAEGSEFRREPRSVIHDAEWAVGMMEEKRLNIVCHSTGNYSIRNDDSYWMEVESGNLIQTIETWKARYDPDKPEMTREEKAVELLGYLREKVSIPDQELLDAIDTFLKKAVEDADDEGGSTHVD